MEEDGAIEPAAAGFVQDSSEENPVLHSSVVPGKPTIPIYIPILTKLIFVLITIL